MSRILSFDQRHLAHVLALSALAFLAVIVLGVGRPA
jgi:hypothetical protein